MTTTSDQGSCGLGVRYPFRREVLAANECLLRIAEERYPYNPDAPNAPEVTGNTPGRQKKGRLLKAAPDSEAA